MSYPTHPYHTNKPTSHLTTVVRLLMPLLILSAVAILSSCTPSSNSKTLAGVWQLNEFEHPYGWKAIFKPGNTTYWNIYTADSTMYEFEVSISPKDTTFIYSTSYKYNYQEIKPDSVIYQLNGDTYPAHFINDTTLMLQKRGSRQKWCKITHIPESQYIDIIKQFGYHSTQIQQQNTLLYISVLSLLIIVIIVGWLLIHSIMKRRRINSQLQKLKQEQAHRTTTQTTHRQESEQEYFASQHYLTLLKQLDQGTHLTPSDWDAIDSKVNQLYPGFSNNLHTLCNITEAEYHTCLLIKLKITPSAIAKALCKERSAVSNIRSRLYKKIFAHKGSAKDWDEFILTL